MKHLFTTLLLALCATLTAAAQTATIGGLLFEVTSPTTCKVSQDEDPSPSGDVTIPSQVSIDGKNYTVTAIDFGAFWACKTLTSISIPAAVTTIDDNAFMYCEALLRIDVHEANEHFCSVDGVLFDKEKTTFIAYPAGKANTTYEIPAFVTTIGSGAFDGCKVLTSISIPNSVTTIGYGAFRYCNALTGIEIPASVTSINGDEFYGCTALSHINVHEANKHFCSVDGVLFNKDKSSIIAYPAGKTNKTYEIPASVTDIGTSAFSYCEALTRISIPKSVTYIGIKALEDSENITSICCYAKKPPVIDMHDFFPYDATIHVPKGCKKAYLRAEYWQDCTIVDNLSLTAQNTGGASDLSFVVTSPTTCKVNRCKAEIFHDTVTIPSEVSIKGKNYTVTAIGDKVFKYCSDLTSVTIPNTVTSIGESAFWGCEALQSINIPNGVTTIGDRAFSNCNALQSINIPSSVTYIGDFTFSDCSAVTCINIPGSVTTIGQGAFSDCDALTSINIPNSVTSIGDYTFSWCKALQSINIPNSVTSISGSAFLTCPALTSFNVDKDNPAYCSIDGVLFTKDGRTLVAYPAGKEMTSYSIPEGVTAISKCAFYNCEALTSVSIPQSVTSIGESAFSGCEALTSVNIPSSVTTIDGETFYGCEALTSISIPASVTDIACNAFSYCHALPRIDVHEANEHFCSVDGVLFDKEKTTIIAYPLGKTNTTYEIPASVTTIGSGAFSGCKTLTSVNIPQGVTTINSEAFFGCKALTSIDIPSNVTDIDEFAFDYCENLTTVRCYAKTPPFSGENGPCFSEDAIIHVPRGCKKAYSKDYTWEYCTIVDDL